MGTPYHSFWHPLGPLPNQPHQLRAIRNAQLAAGVTISPSFSEARLAPEATVAVTWRPLEATGRFPVDVQWWSALSSYTPRKINMEHNHGGLEDHFPF